MRALLSSSALLLSCSLFGCAGSGSTGTTTTTNQPASTSATLAATPNPAASGSPVTLTATIASRAGTPTGSVTFLDGTTSAGTGTLTNGAASLTTSSFAVGVHSLSVQYAATSTYAASTSAAVSLTVNALPPAATTTVLTVAPNPAVAGAAVTLTAAVNSMTGAPTGTVSFADGATNLGTATLSGSTASYVTSSLSVGTHSLTATYAAAATFAASTSAPVSLSVTAAPTANGTLSFATPHQTMIGFGGAEAFYASYLDAHPSETQMMKALYDPVNGLGITFLRLQNNYYNFNGSNASSFDNDDAQIMTASTAALGTKPTLLLTAWTPPASLKSNNSINGCTTTTNGNCTAGFGTLAQVNGAYNYAGYGQFWLSSLQAYAKQGLVPDYISMQNEPDFPSSYVGCVFNPTEAPAKLFQTTQSLASYGQAFNATYQAIHASGALTTVPQMIGPESFSLYNVQALLTEVPATELAAIGHHLYNVSSYGGSPAQQDTPMQTLAGVYPTTPKFETEYFQTPGFLNAMDIHKALTEANDSVYLYWALTWPSTLTNGIATDQQGLLYIDNPYAPSTWAYTAGWTYNDAYYTLKHYSYFVRPGYIRYDATSDNPNEVISVFQSPDKSKTVLVVLNTSTSVTDTLALKLAGVNYSTSAIYRSSFNTPITTAGAERWALLGSYSAQGVTLPPQSAVTVVLTK